MANLQAPPPASQNASQNAPPPQSSNPAVAPANKTISSLPPSIAPPAPATQPEFGKASPLRNPLRQPNVFNSNPRRPEHHRQPAPGTKSTFERPPNPALAPVTRDGFYLPGQKRQPVPAAGQGAQLSADFFEISKPSNAPPRSIQAAPRPAFSSLGPKTVFQPFRPVVPRPNNVIMLDDDGDAAAAFNPDAALRDDRFGAADPYMYVDPSKAGEDIKALLEGAFDDDEDRPKTRLRNRAKKPPVAKSAITSLEAKLANLQMTSADDGPDGQQPADEDEEEEDGTVEGMAIKLLPHQVEGVAWMLDKESGERKKNGVLPKGGILADDMGLGKTIQSVTLILTNPRPPPDAKVPEGSKRKTPGKEVGKGTLVVAPLALIKQWESEIKTRVAPSHAMKVLVHHGSSRTKSHLELKKYDVVITTYQILSSEHAGSSDADDGIKIGCFGVHWYRVILDEAHSIKNRSAKSTQACYALRSWYRWCLTGTPMQNNLDELQSLIHFLRIKPYNELSHWKLHITGPMKNGKGQFAIKRVQYFLKAFMKRRTKDILKQEGALNFGGKKEGEGGEKSQGMKIVKREIKSVICDLDDYERELYDKLAQRANDRLQSMMGEAKTDYIGALVLLLRLRQACNHPQLIKSAMRNDKDALATAGIGSQSPTKQLSADADLDDLANMFGGLDVKLKNCDVCQADLRPEEVKAGAIRCSDCERDLNRTEQRERQTSKEKGRDRKGASKTARRQRTRKVVEDSDDDGDDVNGENEEGGGEWLGSPSEHKTPLKKAGGTDDEDAEGGGRSLGSVDSETDSDESDDDMKRPKRRPIKAASSHNDSASDVDPPGTYDTSSASYPSTKIRHLLTILRREAPQHKIIVFSQFTTMLDLIQPHLDASHLPYARYDGSLPNPAREAALHALRTDPATRVLLCSLKCGSLGLNLTAASRVVLVEPFWNPFVEEQAIDRVHRLNQTVDVEVFKLTVRDSVEERILALQEKKRELARAAIEGGKAVAKLSMRDLLGLFGGGLDVVDPKAAGRDDGVGLLPPMQKRGEVRGTVAVGQRVVSGGAKRVVERKSGGRVEDSVYGRR